jgi:hypothetical protein
LKGVEHDEGANQPSGTEPWLSLKLKSFESERSILNDAANDNAEKKSLNEDGNDERQFIDRRRRVVSRRQTLQT